MMSHQIDLVRTICVQEYVTMIVTMYVTKQHIDLVRSICIHEHVTILVTMFVTTSVAI